MSDTNNNIPTRITQLEEATEYEDGMFYAVAKAGRGTYKIPVDEMTPNEQALSDKIENEIVPVVENSFAYGTVDESEIASFPDGSELPLKSLEVAVNPVQDLHGYDAPWVGGSGKNKLKYPYYASSTTINGVTFTVNDDGTVKVNGTASADASFYLAYTGSDMVLPQGEYTLNGCPSGGSNATYMLNITNISTQDTGSGANFTSDGTTSLNIRIIVRANTTASNLLFKPMIRLATVSDATFEPYSNICPISGWSAVDVSVVGKNLWGGEKLADDIVAKVPQATKDTTNKTVTYFASQVTGITLFNGFKSNTQYTIYLSATSTYTNALIRYSDGTTDGIEPNTYKVTYANKTVSEIRGSWASGTTVLKYEECGIFEGVITAQDFEPYNPNSEVVTIQLGDTYYVAKLDVVSGVLTVDRVEVIYDGSNDENWAVQGSAGFYIDLSDKKAGMDNYIANNYKATNSSGWDPSTPVDNFSGHPTLARLYFRYPYEGFSADLTAWRSWLASNNVQVVYELATPLEIPLGEVKIDSLKGYNNISADTGNILKVEYIRDLDIVINSLLERIAALEG